MLNNSQNAGCIGRSPYSHCAQARRDVWSNSAHLAWVRPAAARAATISAVVGDAARPARLRFGWLTILEPGCGRFERAMGGVDGASVGLRLRNRRGTREGFAFVAEFAVDAPYKNSILVIEFYVRVYRGIPVFMVDGNAKRKKCFHFISPAPVARGAASSGVLTVPIICALRINSSVFSCLLTH